VEVRLDEGRRRQPALGVELDGAALAQRRADPRDPLAADGDVDGAVVPRDPRVPDDHVHTRYGMTWSARKRTDDGIVRPRARAAL
jgi:hypothetical protein